MKGWLFGCILCCFMGACFADNEGAFTYIYEHRLWGTNEEGKGTSGHGSEISATVPYLIYLQEFIRDNDIQTVVDLGCGDWSFSKFIDWEGIDYIGVDVVKFLIEENQELYGSENISFVHADGASFDLPEADLLLCKDVMQHLTYDDISLILEQLPKFRYCLITNDVDLHGDSCINQDIYSGGGYRLLDITQSPFEIEGMKVLVYDVGGVNRKLVLLVENTW